MKAHPEPVRNEQSTGLIDRFGRRVHYLRISVTDRCDFRCVYCMTEDMQFVPRKQVLSLEEIYRIAATFVACGVDKIRLTGGEPLVRRGIVQLVERLGQLPGVRELVMTTNGSQLEKYAEPLQKAGIKRLNISLDSLNPQRFRQMTRTGNLNRVLEGIEAAKAANFQRLKINSVILRGYNDSEVIPLVEFARSIDADISFIEEMPLGEITEHIRKDSQVSSSEIKKIIAAHWPLRPSAETTDGPSRYYRMPDHSSRIGFISPHSNNFCASCNRVRLTAEGRLLLCLGNDHSVDLRRVVRDYPDNPAQLELAIREAIQIKPERHYFDYTADNAQIVRLMNMTGG